MDEDTRGEMIGVTLPSCKSTTGIYDGIGYPEKEVTIEQGP